jgi:hypothetical protein
MSAMKALDVSTRLRLTKLLGGLGSDDPAKRERAALAAHRLITQTGLSWAKVLRPPPVDRRLPQHGKWRETVAKLLDHPEQSNNIECAFLADLSRFRRISMRQRYWLQTIADRVLGHK